MDVLNQDAGYYSIDKPKNLYLKGHVLAHEE